MRVYSYVQLFYGIRLMLRKQGDCPLGKEAQLIKGREAIVGLERKPPHMQELPLMWRINKTIYC